MSTVASIEFTSPEDRFLVFPIVRTSCAPPLLPPSIPPLASGTLRPALGILPSCSMYSAHVVAAAHGFLGSSMAFGPKLDARTTNNYTPLSPIQWLWLCEAAAARLLRRLFHPLIFYWSLLSPLASSHDAVAAR